VSEHFEERRNILSLTSLPAAGLNQTLNATAEDAADVMEAVKLHTDVVHETLHSSLTAEFPSFDDTTYWGPLDDSFQAFVDMDWNAMGTQDDFLDWAM
jgi:myo-inositol-1-phosphate synthase